MSTTHRDYIPQNAAQFDAFISNLLKYVLSKQVIWAIPSAKMQDVSEAYSKFQQAHTAAIGTHNQAEILARKEAQAATIKALRAFVNQYLRFPPVTNIDRVEMGIPNHDKIRTDHKDVTEIVDYVLHLRNIREIMIDFWVQGSTHKAKPIGYDGAEIVWGILDAPPKNSDDLNYHAMASRTPFAIHFDETERGKTVYIAATWQNGRGIIGQWSEIKSAIVP